jgi:hypothetical protein
MDVEDVLESVVTRLRAQTLIPWYLWHLPDWENLKGKDPYGAVSVIGPFESDVDHSILGIEAQPLVGSVLVAVASSTVEGLHANSKAVQAALRGWSPGTGVTGLKAERAKGYEPVDSRVPVTMIVRHMQFTFRTNL